VIVHVDVGVHAGFGVLPDNVRRRLKAVVFGLDDLVPRTARFLFDLSPVGAVEADYVVFFIYIRPSRIVLFTGAVETNRDNDVAATQGGTPFYSRSTHAKEKKRFRGPAGGASSTDTARLNPPRL
jgi:hypothetical protein